MYNEDYWKDALRQAERSLEKEHGKCEDLRAHAGELQGKLDQLRRDYKVLLGENAALRDQSPGLVGEISDELDDAQDEVERLRGINIKKDGEIINLKWMLSSMATSVELLLSLLDTHVPSDVFTPLEDRIIHGARANASNYREAKS